MALTETEGASVSFVCARTVGGQDTVAASSAPTTGMTEIRIRLSHRETRPARLDAGGVDFDRHARPQQVDRENEPALVRLFPHEHALEADERAGHDADAVALV